MTRVLLVDDDAGFRRAMGKALARKGFAVRELGGGSAAVAALLDEGCAEDVLVLDLKMPGVSGLEVLRRTPRRRPRVVVLTGHGTIPDAVEAMRLGAFSFLVKPIDADELVPVLREAVAPAEAGRDLLWGESAATRELRVLLDRIKDADEPVLFCGETGTGKEVAAAYLHARSRRAAQPFVPINLACAVAPRDPELLGGASAGQAGSGTLFLDEIGELSLPQQRALLRLLEGPLPARLCAATSRDLRALVQEGLFREDLFYRLTVLPVLLPPLRERPEDILPIAEHWLRRLSAHAPAGPLRLSEEARQALLSHDYPGNVRELVNVIRRTALLCRGAEVDGPLLRRTLAEDPFRALRGHGKSIQGLASPAKGLLGSAPADDTPLSLRELELRHIERLLREHKNITSVARLLGIDRRTLQRKLRGLGLDWRED